ncbi:MAG: hypothetical protein AAF992_23660, partial [Bacteroidota bacterium]
MKKILKWTLSIFFSSIIALVLFVFIEDLTYDKSKTDTNMREPRKALILTWEADDKGAFWNSYEQNVHPTITALHQKKLISEVFPFE